MKPLTDFLDPDQSAIFYNLTTPYRIQNFLDEVPYSAEEANRCPLQVIQDRQAHCLDGALFAAAALRQIGYPPIIVDMFPEPGRDDDHVLAIYKRNGFFGAVAKSNFVGLRFREAVYRSLRELVMSYFESFFNVSGEKTLREYTVPLNLQFYDHLDWMVSDSGLGIIEQRLKQIHRFPVINPSMLKDLSSVDKISYQAGMSIANPDGLYKPR
jgi:hypothetical protein